MLETIRISIQNIVHDLYAIDVIPQVSVPDEQFGDVASNVAMQITKQVGSNPREIAETIAAELQNHTAVVETSVAGPGFLNIRLHDTELWRATTIQPEQTYAGQTFVVEYSDMNAFKTAHIGHLYTTLIGDVIAKLCEVAGAQVVRANFGGDVGLHVGKAMWGILRAIDNDPTQLDVVPKHERSAWIAARYIEGNEAYESDELKKQEIIELNKKVYELHSSNDHDSQIAQIYWTCREWSYDGFEQFYDSLELHRQSDGTHFVYYPESETAPFGVQMVEEGKARGVFVESNGALVYDGEKDGLHTRVFLTAQGLPTYETKDLGLALKKWQDYQFDRSIIITANDIKEYMKVIVAALRHFQPEISDRTTHITHGLVKMAGGQKMSSRSGNVLLPEDVITASLEASRAVSGKEDMKTVIGAIKYSFLKNRVGGDMIYDPQESVAVEGNSGPYLQYAHARACSILRKVEGTDIESLDGVQYEAGERTMMRQLAQFSEVMNEAVKELSPHLICSYLYELTQTFNSFYEHNRVIDDSRQDVRIEIVRIYQSTLSKGLSILGIHAPEQM